jgi:hypothetical protein
LAKSNASGGAKKKADGIVSAVKAWSPRRRQGPRAVGSFVSEIARPSIEKFGFASVALFEQWSRIAGSELAAFCQPERIRWPRARKELPETDADGPVEGASLVLRVDPARALDVQYSSEQIIERINASFGYRAVSRLTIVQAPIAGAAALAREAPVKSPVADKSQTGLEGALERMRVLRRLASERRR